MIQIGPYKLSGRAVLAPMAGVTDFPFRQVCKKQGAAMVTAEMCASNPALKDTIKSRLRTANAADTEPRTVQIVGTEPRQMADAASYQADQGAQIIDINMGCPAKKVCRKLAGSALMKDEKLVSEILETVVDAVSIPVTLKIRTGWDQSNRNAVNIARLAEECGINSLAVHGRTRACRYRGIAEYDTIAEVVQIVNIPVFANGDITSAIKAKEVLEYTGANGVMIGRSAQGQPWIFREINDLLNKPKASSELFTAKSLVQNDTRLLEHLIMEHLHGIHSYYGEFFHCESHQNVKMDSQMAVKMARKHISWYFEQIKQITINRFTSSADTDNSANNAASRAVDQEVKRLTASIEIARKQFNQLCSETAQLEHLQQFFGDLQTTGDIAA